MSMHNRVKVFEYDLEHVHDRIVDLDISLEKANRLIGIYLELRLNKSGYLVVHPTHTLLVRTDPYFKYIEDKLDGCRLMSLLNPTNIPSQLRAAECRLIPRDHSLWVVFP